MRLSRPVLFSYDEIRHVPCSDDDDEISRGLTERKKKKKKKKKKEKNKSNRVRTTDAFSGKLPEYLSLNSLLNGILSYS